MQVELREPKTREEFDLYYDLRWRILREPWTSVRESGKDDHEQNAFHLTAWAAGKLAGAGRLHLNSPEEAQVRYMAVEEGWSGRGIGSLIRVGLEEAARRCGAKHIMLNARESAVPFYRKHKYELIDQSGTLFESLVHWLMRKEL
jgi:GNAT superfamily N-acetyltransferase